MPFSLGMLGQQAAGSLAGGLIGMGLQSFNNRQQINMNKEMLQYQIAANKEMSDYTQNLQKDMWDYTNFGNQVKHLKEAGLNPALLYGKGGGGGATVGNGGSQVSASSMQRGTEGMAGLGMGLQLATQKAQIELLLAEARRANAEAGNQEGGIKRNLDATYDNIIASTANIQARTEVEKTVKELNSLEMKIKGDTVEDIISSIKLNNQQAMQQLESLARNNYINEQTKQDMISIFHSNAIKAGVEIELAKSNVKLTDEQRKAIPIQLAQGWRKLSIEQQNAISNAANAEAAGKQAVAAITSAGAAERNAASNAESVSLQKMLNDMPESEKMLYEIFGGIVKAIGMGAGMGAMGAGRTVIGGFGKR